MNIILESGQEPLNRERFYVGHYGRLHEYQQQSQDELTSTSEETSFWKDMLIYDGGAAGDGESQEDRAYPSKKNVSYLDFLL